MITTGPWPPWKGSSRSMLAGCYPLTVSPGREARSRPSSWPGRWRPGLGERPAQFPGNGVVHRLDVAWIGEGVAADLVEEGRHADVLGPLLRDHPLSSPTLERKRRRVSKSSRRPPRPITASRAEAPAEQPDRHLAGVGARPR